MVTLPYDSALFFIFKFVVAALFLQWEGLFQDDEDLHCNVQEMLVDAVKRWSHSNPCGRVIVVRLSEKQPCNGEVILMYMGYKY